MFRIPPGGFAGYAQMTPASRLALSPALPTRNGSPQRRRRKAKTATARRAKKRSNGRKLKFGSPAWRKKFMKGGARRSRKRAKK